MPIEIYTGKPGNGKTALMIERMMAEAAKPKPRPMFAGGVDGLAPGLATVLKDPRTWNAVKPGERCTCHDTEDSGPCDAHEIPNGSLIFIDEAWKWFGHLHDASRQATPPHVLGLAEHRHRGIDFIWTSQGPNQIYPFARPLIADHYHTVRQFGTSVIDVYHWQELQEEVKSQAKRDLADRTTRKLPAASFGKYKSAEEHTIKRKLPWKVYALPAVVIAAGVLVWLSVQLLKPDRMAAQVQGTGAAQAAPSPGMAGPTDGKARAPMTTTEYIAVFTPRVAAQPWTAPAFDGREVQAQPELFCMSSEASCSCLTEQGTRYILPEAQCRYMARWGPSYNAFKAPQPEQVQPMQPQAEGPSQDVAGVDLGSTIEGDPAKVNGAGVAL